jgi:molybdopterin biosynthesis enzyme MoaB
MRVVVLSVVSTNRFVSGHLRQTGARRVCQVSESRTTFLIQRETLIVGLSGKEKRGRRALESPRGAMALEVAVPWWGVLVLL